VDPDCGNHAVPTVHGVLYQHLYRSRWDLGGDWACRDFVSARPAAEDEVAMSTFRDLRSNFRSILSIDDPREPINTVCPNIMVGTMRLAQNAPGIGLETALVARAEGDAGRSRKFIGGTNASLYTNLSGGAQREDIR